MPASSTLTGGRARHMPRFSDEQPARAPRRPRKLAARARVCHASPARRPFGRPTTRRTIMADAAIVSTARTGIGRAYRGAFNNTHGATLTGHVIKAAIERARIEPSEVEDVILGCAL